MDSKGKKILALSGLACLVFFFFMLKAGRLYYDHRVPNFERVAEI
jgi:TM2 domain-containing membrane protein YozV